MPCCAICRSRCGRMPVTTPICRLPCRPKGRLCFRQTSAWRKLKSVMERRKQRQKSPRCRKNHRSLPVTTLIRRLPRRPQGRLCLRQTRVWKELRSPMERLKSPSCRKSLFPNSATASGNPVKKRRWSLLLWLWQLFSWPL